MNHKKIYGITLFGTMAFFIAISMFDYAAEQFPITMGMLPKVWTFAAYLFAGALTGFLIHGFFDQTICFILKCRRGKNDGR